MSPDIVPTGNPDLQHFMEAAGIEPAVYSDRVVERFQRRVAKTRNADHCWLWAGAVNREGYGYFWDGSKNENGNNRIIGAHRVAWALTNGFLRDDLQIHHVCQQPRCVNPRHLVAATATDHNAAHGRVARHGSVRMYFKGCRCMACREAKSIANKRERVARAARSAA